MKSKSPPIGRETQILDACVALFLARGIAAVSTRDVAEHLGIARSHVYHYFADWQTLRIAAFEHHMRQEIAAADAGLALLKPEQALGEFIHACFDKNAGAQWMLWIDAWDEAVRDAAFAARYQAMNEQWVGLLAATIQRGIDAGDFPPQKTDRAARQILALITGYLTDTLMVPKPVLVKRARDEVRSAVDQLLKAKS
jgi:AcrR family transcriptional regulator